MIYLITTIGCFIVCGYYIGLALSPRRAVSPSGETIEPIETRVLRPAWNRIRNLIYALTPKGKLERLANKAASLNIRLDPIAVAVGQLMSGIAAFACLYKTGLMWAIPAGIFAYCTPEIIIDRLITERRMRIRLALPAFLNSIVIHIEAGHSIDKTVMDIIESSLMEKPGANEDWISTYRGRPLYEEFAKGLVTIRNGTAREIAFRGIIERSGVPELSATLNAILQALKLGADLGSTLRAQANNIRVKRRQRAQENAEKAAWRLGLTAFCFLFAFVLVLAAILYPDLAGVMGGFNVGK